MRRVSSPPIEMVTFALLGPFFSQSSFRDDDDLRGFRVGACAAACASICCSTNFCRRSTSGLTGASRLDACHDALRLRGGVFLGLVVLGLGFLAFAVIEAVDSGVAQHVEG